MGEEEKDGEERGEQEEEMEYGEVAACHCQVREREREREDNWKDELFKKSDCRIETLAGRFKLWGETHVLSRIEE